MTKVIITVEADTGSHLTVTEREIASSYPPVIEAERQRISGLLRTALGKVDQAYGLSETPAESAGGAE